MSGPTYQPGDLVDITIKGARVSHEGDASGWLNYFLGMTPHRVMADRPEVTVKHTEFDPRPGDVWTDRDGDTWFVVVGKPGHPRMRGKTDAWITPTGLYDNHGPLTLVHREGGTR